MTTPVPAPGHAPDGPPVPDGQRDYEALRAGGVSQQDADSWRDQQSEILRAGGATETQIQDHWGRTYRGSPTITDHVQNNLASHPNLWGGTNVNPTVAHDFSTAIAAGLGNSVTGLAINRHAPDVTDSPDPTLRIVSGLAQMAGDSPAIITGAVGGGAVAGAAGIESGPGAVITGLLGVGFGSQALPEAARQTMLTAYRAGEIHTPAEWFQAVTSATWNTAKAGIVGAVSNLVGGPIGGRIAGATGSRLLGLGADATAQAITGTGVGSALNARLPTADDFVTAAIMAIGTAGAGHLVAGRFVPSPAARRVELNIQNIHERTGLSPQDIVSAAERDPTLRQELMAQDVHGDVVAPNYHAQGLPAPPPFRPPSWPELPAPGQAPRAHAAGHQPPAIRAPSVDPHIMVQREPVPARPGIDHFMGIMGGAEGSFLRGANRGDVAVSPAGARGRYQIMTGTARQYGATGTDAEIHARLMDPVYNTQMARTIAADLYRRFHGDEEAMLAAYNAGPGRGAQLQRQGPGTRLVAERDPHARGGWRYEEQPAARNESFLPHETQMYLARSRVHGGGELPGSRGGGPLPPGGDEGGDMGGNGGGGTPEWAQYRRPEEEPPAGDGGEGGGGPPGGAEPGEPGFWERANADSLHEEMRRGIGDGRPQQPALFDPSRNLRQWVSELEPARVLDREQMAAEGDRGAQSRRTDLMQEDMSRQTYASDARAGAFIRHGAVDPITLDLIPGTHSVMDAVRAVTDDGGKLPDWVTWMVAKRAVLRDNANPGMETPLNMRAARALIENRGENAKYERATNLFNEVRRSVLEYAKGSGTLSERQVAAMTAADPLWISFRRVMGMENRAGAPGGRGMKVGKSVHSMDESARLLDDPMIASVDNFHLMIKMADRNRAIGHLIGRIEAGELAAGEFKREGVVEGAQLRDDDGVFKDYTMGHNGGPALEEAFAPLLAERATNGKLAANEFVYYRNGVAERWSAKNPAVAELMRGADTPEEANVIGKIGETFATMARNGIVNTADFALKMTGIDQWTAFIHDPLHPPPFFTLLRGALPVLLKNDWYERALTHGAFGASIREMHTDYIQRDVGSIFEKTGVFDRLWNTVKHPIEMVQAVSETLDQMDRVGYMRHAESKGIEPIKAATMARKAYIDFPERGTLAVANMLAKQTPFMRPGILGLKQVGESLAERPLETAMYSIGAVTIPTVLLYALNYIQDQDPSIPEAQKFRNIPRWERDSMYITPQINGVRIKLGMPREMGPIFGGLVNRLLDHYLQHDPVHFDDWAMNTVQRWLPNVSPAWLTAPIENAFNHSTFTGRQLVPDSLMQNSNHMQYSANTTQTAIAVARFLAPHPDSGRTWGMDISPIVIENYARSWGGSIGIGVMHVLDIPLRPPGTGRPWELADIPFVSGFVVRNPGASAQPISDFYDNMREVTAAQRDVALARRRNNETELTMAAGNPLAYARLTETQSALSNMATAIRGINDDATMSRDEKRQMIEQTYSDMIMIARNGNSLVQQFRDSLHEPTQASPAVGGAQGSPRIQEGAGGPAEVPRDPNAAAPGVMIQPDAGNEGGSVLPPAPQ